MSQENIGKFQDNFRLKMLQGNLVASRLMEIANAAFDTSAGQAPAELLGMGCYTLLRILEEKPYSGDVLLFADKLLDTKRFRNVKLAHQLDYLHKYQAARPEKDRVQQLLSEFEVEEAERILTRLDDVNPGDPEVLWERTLRRLSSGGAWEQYLSQTDRLFRGTPFEWWWHWTLGAARFLAGQYESALAPIQASLQLRANSHAANLLAETIYRLGERDRALALWRESLRYDPLQMHLYLKMHDTVTRFDELAQHDLAGENICILVYCWNKREILEATLVRLAQSNLGKARILMLNNASSDGTGDLMERAPLLFPENPCRVMHLPTNIGAPAARNWLMAQPEARQADYIAYLDDDVDLPADWLGRLLATLKAFPGAAVAGSRIVDPLPVPTLQYGGVFIETAEEDSLRVTCKHANEPDYGQLNYVRSCVSVMGCCHLFRNRALYDVGEFDVRFSPTQVDDMEHDIRTVLKGYEVIYNGHNRVVHHQKTGKQSILNRAARGNVVGNVHKMITKHPAEEMRRIKLEAEARDRDYMRHKIGDLRSAELLDGVREVPFGIV